MTRYQKGFECCKKNSLKECKNCPYYEKDDHIRCYTRMIIDAEKDIHLKENKIYNLTKISKKQLLITEKFKDFISLKLKDFGNMLSNEDIEIIYKEFISCLDSIISES